MGDKKIKLLSPAEAACWKEEMKMNF